MHSLRKKGGIFIKKINIFLILLVSIYLTKSLIVNTKAETSNFYEAEYIDDIYINKHNKENNTIYYQKARFFRKSNTNEFAYCIEPFNFFNENSSYESTLNPENLTKEQIDYITMLAYFGYGYANHTDSKWYAITQFLIWQAADPNGNFYFTDKLNGNKIDPYLVEIQEIKDLITSYKTLPSFHNNTFTIIENNRLTLTDTNNIIKDYIIPNENIKIINNELIIENLPLGNHIINLKKENKNYNKPYIFYTSPNSQNLLLTGDIKEIETKVTVNVIQTSIRLYKVDNDTVSITPQGESSLDGAKYALYDENYNKVKEVIIINNEAIIENINFGRYFLKEILPGVGYTLDKATYEINITDKSYRKELVLKNKVIEKQITIKKVYGQNNIYKTEQNITFNITNKNNELIKTVTTNEFGIAEFSLPYGTYTVTQLNSTEGYFKVNPITLNITDTEEETLELKDLKIPVPDTSINYKSFILSIIRKLFLILC